jgi:hypothetical protein
MAALANGASQNSTTFGATRCTSAACRTPAQPLHASHLAELVRDLGVPALAGRTAVLRQLVLQVPAHVVAQALGYHDNTTTRVATEAGTLWSRYASGDHDHGHQPE